jgi:hypothetical protein
MLRRAVGVPMKRYATTTARDSDGDMVYCCNDGTRWVRMGESQWLQLDQIPQPLDLTAAPVLPVRPLVTEMVKRVVTRDMIYAAHADILQAWIAVPRITDEMHASVWKLVELAKMAAGVAT